MNAKVVLPKELFADGDFLLAISGNNSGQRFSIPSEAMRRVLAISSSNANIVKYKMLKKELLKGEQAYKKAYQTSYETTLIKHNDDLNTYIDSSSGNSTNTASGASSGNTGGAAGKIIAGPANQNPVTPKPEKPKFKFTFKNPIVLADMKTALPVPAYETLLGVLEVPTKVTGGVTETIQGQDDTSLVSYQEIYSMIDSKIAEHTDVIIENTASQENAYISLGGVIIPVNEGYDISGFSYQICPNIYNSGINVGESYVNFYLSLVVDDPSWHVLSVKTTVEKKAPNNQKVEKTSFGQSRSGRNNIMLHNLHANALTKTDFETTMNNLTVDITFTNGAKKSLVVDFSGKLYCISGRSLTEITPPDFVLTRDNNPINTQLINKIGIEKTFVPLGFGVKQLGIADYRKVEQSVQGYIEGEVAAIENIMAREYKEKATRKLRRSDNTVTTSSETEKEQLRDTTTTDRFEMQNEIAKMLQEDKDFSAGANFQASWGKDEATTGKYSLGANVNMATHSSKQESTRLAVNQAKEVTERALERIVAKVKQERIEKIVEEFEENNKHGYDNTKGDSHVVGVYRWVDKIYKNQVVNYGKRLIFEFMVPEPAKLHLLGMVMDPIGTKLVKPDDPRTFEEVLNLSDYKKITKDTAKYWGSKFNVKLTPEPVEVMDVGKSFSFTTPETNVKEWDEAAAGHENITLPEGYYSESAQARWFCPDEGAIGTGTVIGGQQFTENGKKVEIPKFVGSIPVSYSSVGYHAGSVNFVISVRVLEETKLKWQQETFKAIIDGYEEALHAFEQKLAEENAKGVVIKEANPGFYRQIENMVLRKNCISYIIDQNPSAKRTYGKDMFRPLSDNVKRDFGNHEISVDANLDDYGSFVKFIEQAFEWDIMSYNFYPYYWASRSNWSELYQNDNNDPLFRNFMQAGMARVIVTVRPGFEDAVTYYMQTGQIWNGGEVPIIEDKMFLSIVDELRQPTGEKEGKAWATRLPTALTILQADSIGLKVDKALPFEENLSDFEEPDNVPKSKGLSISNSQLGTSQKARIVGKISGGENKEAKIVLKNLDGTIRDLTYCNPSGIWELNDISVGKYQLSLDANTDFPNTGFEVIEGSKEQTVELAANKTLEVKLTVKKRQ
jgi:hypothetical protein